METQNTTPNNENESSNENQTSLQDEKQPVPENNIIPFEPKRVNLFDEITEEISELREGQEQLFKGASEMFSKVHSDLKSNPDDIDGRQSMMINMTKNIIGNISEKIKFQLALYALSVIYFIILGIIYTITFALKFPNPSSYLSILVLGFLTYKIISTIIINIRYKNIKK